MKEEVYVSQPDGFVNLDFPDHVYRLKKALHGLKQAPRACQSQYAIKLLKKHGIDECVSMSTHMATKRLDADLQGTPTDQTTYRQIIGGFMYLTTSRPYIAFATFVCARYQARPTVKHLKEVKRIFRYLRQSYNIGLWYSKDYGFELIAYSDADHARKDDVKARTTLLLSLLDEHQLRFSKYKTAQELWAAILKTFGSNKATKKTKKNLLKQQYGNFKAEGSETLEQTFNRLQVIVEWLMHTIVWRNKSDLNAMSLDDMYNHLKVYESEVQKKSEPNPQNIAFISSAKHSRVNENVNTASVSIASTNVPTASANIGVASIS
nr:uncharacterized mitochondrial protein AtMg00810-like [Tanacetum cinerariifolium]